MKISIIKKAQAQLEDIELENIKKKINRMKMEREVEVEEPDIDVELEAEDLEAQRIIYDNNKDNKYWVTEYKVSKSLDEADDRLEIINSTEVIGLENAENLLEEMEEKYDDVDDILVYLEDFDDKGILASEDNQTVT